MSRQPVPEQAIRSTTIPFYHLGKKLGRTHEAQAVCSFLNGEYCTPFGLLSSLSQGAGYYSLLWRFAVLQGCSEHVCHLLNKCGHCGREIQIFVSPLKISKYARFVKAIWERAYPTADHRKQREASIRLMDSNLAITAAMGNDGMLLITRGLANSLPFCVRQED